MAKAKSPVKAQKKPAKAPLKGKKRTAVLGLI